LSPGAESGGNRERGLEKPHASFQNVAMRMDDIRCYLALRSQVSNAWKTTRFRRPSRHAGRELVVRLREGPPVYVRSGTQDYSVFRESFVEDVYRMADARDWDCVVDLGANVGMFAAYAAQFARRVIAYEPFPENLRQFCRNCGGRPNVQVVGSAVAGQPGKLRLYRPKSIKHTAVHSSFREMANLLSDEFDEVEAVTLDQLFARHAIARCDLLKIDVEGQEYDILHHASDETLSRIARIHGEYHDVLPDDPRTRIGNFSAFLADRGYAVTVDPHPFTPNYGMFFADRRP
jgi:FkbM family methyltransferase